MDDALKTRLESLIHSGRIVLFMKGNRSFPQCGFSAHVLGILKQKGVPFETFNILGDPDVRQGLKEYSGWPTYPQLYVDGKLVGGADIVSELESSGQLSELLAQPAS